MILLRNIAYNLVFFAGSVGIVLLVPLVALGGRRAMIPYAQGWARYHGWCARVLLGIRVRFEGERSAGRKFYACKHQSMLETTVLIAGLPDAAPVIKRELSRVPLWGRATLIYGSIAVDRDASATALRAMLREAKRVEAEGRSVLIFPEGTRVALGEQPPLQSGFAGMYRALALPVVPIALDTGILWPRRGLKRPGTVTFRFGEPIPPGLPRKEIEARVHAAINVLDHL